MKKLWFSNLALVLGCLSTSTALGQYPGAYGSLAPSSYPVQYPQIEIGPRGPVTGQMPATWGQMNGTANQMMGNPMMGSPSPTYSAPSQSYMAMNPSSQLGAMQVQNYNQTAMMHPQAMSGVLQPGWFGQRSVPFQLAGAQENVYAQPLPSPLVPPPVPMAAPMQGGPQASMNSVPQSIIEEGSQIHNAVNPSVQNQGQALPYQMPPNAMMMNPAYGQSIAPGCTSCGSAPLAESYGYPMSSPQSYGPQYSAPQMGRIGHFARSMLPGDAPVLQALLWWRQRTVVFSRRRRQCCFDLRRQQSQRKFLGHPRCEHGIDPWI